MGFVPAIFGPGETADHCLCHVLLLVHMQPVGSVAGVAVERTLFSGDLRGLRIQLIFDATAAAVVLLIATALSVYKPWGMTQFGRRKQHRNVSEQ